MHHKITILGHLGKDPDQRFTPNGKMVTNFSVATNRNWTDKRGEPRESVIWFKVTCWGRLAETTSQYLHKGSGVFLEAYLTGTTKGNPRIWSGRNGVAHSQFEVTATFVKFLGGGSRPDRDDHNSEAFDHQHEEEEIPF